MGHEARVGFRLSPQYNAPLRCAPYNAWMEAHGSWHPSATLARQLTHQYNCIHVLSGQQWGSPPRDRRVVMTSCPKRHEDLESPESSPKRHAVSPLGVNKMEYVTEWWFIFRAKTCLALQGSTSFPQIYPKPVDCMHRSAPK